MPRLTGRRGPIIEPPENAHAWMDEPTPPTIPRMTRLQITRLHAGLGREELAGMSGIGVETIIAHEEGVSEGYEQGQGVGQRLADALSTSLRTLAQRRGIDNWLDLWEGGGEVWVKREEGGWQQVSDRLPATVPAYWSPNIVADTYFNVSYRIV